MAWCNSTLHPKEGKCDQRRGHLKSGKNKSLWIGYGTKGPQLVERYTALTATQDLAVASSFDGCCKETNSWEMGLPAIVSHKGKIIQLNGTSMLRGSLSWNTRFWEQPTRGAVTFISNVQFPISKFL